MARSSLFTPTCPRPVLIRWFAACIALCWTAGWPATPATAAEIGAAEKVVHNVYGTSLTRRMKTGEPLVTDQKVRTKAESAATLVFADDSRLSVGPQSEVVLDDFVYQPNKNLATGAINLAKGLMRFTSSKKKLDVKVKTPTATIGIRGTIFDVLVSRQGTEVAVREGAVEVDTAGGSERVAAGQSMTVPNNGGSPRIGPPSPALQQALAEMTTLLPASTAPRRKTDTQAPQQEAQNTPSKLAATGSAATDMVLPPELLQDRDLESLLVVTLDSGILAIQLRADLAPKHAAWIKQLVRENFYDGIVFHNVVAGFAAQAGDPAGTGTGGANKAMAAEFSDARFIRGSVGMKAKRNQAGTATSQFFILMKAAPHLDGKYTYLGDVIYGMEQLNRLSAGQPPKQPSPIIRMRVAADIVQ